MAYPLGQIGMRPESSPTINKGKYILNQKGLRSEVKDFRFLRKVLGSRQIDNLIVQAKDMEQQRKEQPQSVKRRRNREFER